MANTMVKNSRLPAGENNKILRVALQACAGVAAVCALLLTFTVGDYYIFNRVLQYGCIFTLSQWVKKAGLILAVMAAFFKSRKCADTIKYILPVFVVMSCFLFGEYFDITPSADTTNEEIFNSVNLFMPKWLACAAYFLHNAALLCLCILVFLRDGFGADGRSFVVLPCALLGALPLNIFENFFDISSISQSSFLRFKNFTVWHLVAILTLAGVTIGLYFYLKGKSGDFQNKTLAALAVSLLLQYHSKDSVVMGDGYNVYRTVFACLPLFICNIGVYVASASVIFKRKTLYDISFFIHAVGALTVFVYFGKDEMSDYGIFCSYSILYFCYTHCILFALCVLPSALGHYKFKLSSCIVPLIYYFIVIIIASLASGLVSYLSTQWRASDGSTLIYDNYLVTGVISEGGAIGSAGYMRPNYAFTQVNPLPFSVPWPIKLGGFMQYINLLYVLWVYIAYVGLFFTFYGLYRAYLAVYGAARARLTAKRETPAAEERLVENIAEEQIAITAEEQTGVAAEERETEVAVTAEETKNDR